MFSIMKRPSLENSQENLIKNALIGSALVCEQARQIFNKIFQGKMIKMKHSKVSLLGKCRQQHRHLI